MKKIILFLSVLISSMLVFSQSQDTVILDECVVTFYRATETTPITFKNLDKIEIDKISVGQEPSFILSQTPSITCYSDAGNGVGYSYFRLRGIDQTRINMTFDGVPLNEPEDQGVYFNNYPDFINSVSSIQIQRGIGISSNGVASYGGSINFESPLLFGERSAEVGFDIGTTFQQAMTNSLEKSSRIFAEYNSGKIGNHGLYLRLSNVSSDGYKYNSSNKSKSMLFSYGYMKNKHVLKLTGFVGHQQNGMAWLGTDSLLLAGDPRFNSNTESEKDDFLQSLVKLQHNYYISDKSKLSSTVYYNFLNGNYDFDNDNFNLYENEYISHDGSINYHLTHHFVGAFTNYSYTNNNFKLNSGLHLNSFNRTHMGTNSEIDTLMYSNIGEKKEISFFTKINYSMKNLTLFADINVRKTWFNYEDTYKDENNNTYFSNVLLATDTLEIFQKNSNFLITPHIGLNYKIKNSSIYTNVGFTEREPSRIDLFGGFDYFSLSLYNNTELKNEKVIDYELGYRYASKNLIANINLYYMHFKDGLIFSKYGNSGIPTNQNKTFNRKGAEFDISYRYNDLTFSNNSSISLPSSFEYGKDSIMIGYLTINPLLVINQNVMYEYKKFVFGCNVRYQTKSYIDYEKSNELEEHLIISLMTTYNMSKNCNITLRLNNITNQTYFSNGYMSSAGQPRYFIQSPFNFNISVRWEL